MFSYVFLALLGAAAATVICSDYGKGGGGEGAEGYYVRPIPGNCRGQHGDAANWKPTFRIKEMAGDCPPGGKKYKDTCYIQLRGGKSHTYRISEGMCNQHKGHIVTYHTREEYLWVEQNVMTQNAWYWQGIFCSVPRGTDPSNFYTPSGEDMRKIQQKMRTKSAQPVSEHTHPCVMSHR